VSDIKYALRAFEQMIAERPIRKQITAWQKQIAAWKAKAPLSIA